MTGRPSSSPTASSTPAAAERALGSGASAADNRRVDVETVRGWLQRGRRSSRPSLGIAEREHARAAADLETAHERFVDCPGPADRRHRSMARRAALVDRALRPRTQLRPGRCTRGPPATPPTPRSHRMPPRRATRGPPRHPRRGERRRRPHPSARRDRHRRARSGRSPCRGVGRAARRRHHAGQRAPAGHRRAEQPPPARAGRGRSARGRPAASSPGAPIPKRRSVPGDSARTRPRLAELVDFADDLDDDQRAGLEAAMEASGLLGRDSTAGWLAAPAERRAHRLRRRAGRRCRSASCWW